MLAITAETEGVILLTFELTLVVPVEVFETCVVKVVVALPCILGTLGVNEPITELNVTLAVIDGVIEFRLVVLSNPERVLLADVEVVKEVTAVVAEVPCSVINPSASNVGGLTEKLAEIEARVVTSSGPITPTSANGAAAIG